MKHYNAEESEGTHIGNGTLQFTGKILTRGDDGSFKLSMKHYLERLRTITLEEVKTAILLGKKNPYNIQCGQLQW